MTHLQKQRFFQSLKRDVIATGVFSLVLLGNWLSVAVAAAATALLVVMWACMLFKWNDIVRKSFVMRNEYSMPLIVLSTIDFAVVQAILWNSPLDPLWMGILTGVYTVVSGAGAYLMIKHYREI